jgi:hypothetical protein
MPSDPTEPHWRPRITLAGLLPLTDERGPGKSLRHSQIPFVYHLYVTWSSLPSQPIGLSHREQAGILATDELPHLRTWTDRLRPPLTPTSTSTAQRDRRDLPYAIDHLTGAISPSVSPSALSSIAIIVSLGEGPQI